MFSLTFYPAHLFNLKFAAKDLERRSKKCDKDEKAEKAKVKKVGNMAFILPSLHVVCS